MNVYGKHRIEKQRKIFKVGVWIAIGKNIGKKRLSSSSPGA
jgi:hypothetical protein